MKTPSLFMAPMTTWSSHSDLTVSDAELEYIEKRASNVDYVITACTFTIKNQQSFLGQFYSGSDDYLPSMMSLSKAIHRGGAKAILQVHSPGRMVSPELQFDHNIDVAAPSSVQVDRPGYRLPRELTHADIDLIITSYHDVTIRAIKAGFDGIEIHGANTYLPQQFVSPLTNKRTDEYGKDRLLFIKNLISRIESAKIESKANEFIIGYRFSPEEREAGGLRLTHTFELLEYLCSTQITYLHASLERYDRTSYFDETLIASALLKVINKRKPLIGVGGIRTKADVQKALALGYDHVALGLTLLLNPNWKTSENIITNISEETIPKDIPLSMHKMLLEFFAPYINSLQKGKS